MEEPFGSGDFSLQGWFVLDLLNIPNASEISDAPSGLVCIPLTLHDDDKEEQAAVLSGMIGYKFHETKMEKLP